MERVYETVRQAAAARSTILVTGESGTGKELVAKALHRLSPRAAGPFVTVHSGALPPDLLESNLFGHVRGAFTGAVADKKGLFKAADGGTIFFDEIGTVPDRHAGQAPARPAGARVHARGRRRADPVRRARDRRDERGSHEGRRGGPLPRGPLLPALRHHGEPAAAARAQGRRPAPRRDASRAGGRGERPRGPVRDARRDEGAPRPRLAGKRARARERPRARARARARRHRPRPASRRGPPLGPAARRVPGRGPELQGRGRRVRALAPRVRARRARTASRRRPPSSSASSRRRSTRCSSGTGCSRATRRKPEPEPANRA